MNTSHDPVNPCTKLGHVYTAVTVVRCQHLEAWSVSVKCWSDNDRGDTDLHFEASHEFGPFDPTDYITARVHELLEVAVGHCVAAGSL